MCFLNGCPCQQPLREHDALLQEFGLSRDDIGWLLYLLQIWFHRLYPREQLILKVKLNRDLRRIFDIGKSLSTSRVRSDFQRLSNVFPALRMLNLLGPMPLKTMYGKRTPVSQVHSLSLEQSRPPRATTKDWEKIWNSAVEGDLDSIPYDIRVRYYSAVRRISSDFARPAAITRRAYLFYGATGTGKSYRAWSEAGEEAYPKDPRTKFWCGYQGQAHVVLDEFRGGIDVAHMLRWLDNYPVSVELKGSSTPLKATNFWITSNLHPCEWYPGLDSATVAALLRRLEIIEMNEPYVL